jgi:hypothetical protein
MARALLFAFVAASALAGEFPDAHAREEDLRELVHLLKENWAYLEDREQHSHLDLEVALRDALVENRTAGSWR